MKKWIVIALAASTAACTTASPEQFYRPLNESTQWVISGQFNQLSYEHNVTVNGETVIADQLPYNGSDATLEGQYNGKKVTSSCHWKSKTDLRCLVKVDGDNAATLTF